MSQPLQASTVNLILCRNINDYLGLPMELIPDDRRLTDIKTGMDILDLQILFSETSNRVLRKHHHFTEFIEQNIGRFQLSYPQDYNQQHELTPDGEAKVLQQITAGDMKQFFGPLLQENYR